jgi:hypothetical protein
MASWFEAWAGESERPGLNPPNWPAVASKDSVFTSLYLRFLIYKLGWNCGTNLRGLVCVCKMRERLGNMQKSACIIVSSKLSMCMSVNVPFSHQHLLRTSIIWVCIHSFIMYLPCSGYTYVYTQLPLSIHAGLVPELCEDTKPPDAQAPCIQWPSTCTFPIRVLSYTWNHL